MAWQTRPDRSRSSQLKYTWHFPQCPPSSSVGQCLSGDIYEFTYNFYCGSEWLGRTSLFLHVCTFNAYFLTSHNTYRVESFSRVKMTLFSKVRTYVFNFVCLRLGEHSTFTFYSMFSRDFPWIFSFLSHFQLLLLINNHTWTEISSVPCTCRREMNCPFKKSRRVMSYSSWVIYLFIIPRLMSCHAMFFVFPSMLFIILTYSYLFSRISSSEKVSLNAFDRPLTRNRSFLGRSYR